jgi:hypothetical protein
MAFRCKDWSMLVVRGHRDTCVRFATERSFGKLSARLGAMPKFEETSLGMPIMAFGSRKVLQDNRMPKRTYHRP